MSAAQPPHDVPFGPTAIDREHAARLLRTARGAPENDDAVEWAFSVMPDSRATRRLRIEQLLRAGNYEAADALLARGLRRRPTDASLSLLRARSLFEQESYDSANRELRLVLARRPEHRGALELAGRVALALGRPLRAVGLFERGERRRPDDAIRGLVAGAWLDAGRTRMARKVLRRMKSPSVLLRARVLRAEGRLLEATELLDRARRQTTGDQHDAVMCTLIDLLEETADLQRLRRLLAPLSLHRPAILARAGTAWLAMGAFHTAAVRMASLARVEGSRASALTVLMVAGAMMNRPRLARRALSRLRRITEPVDRKNVAEAWCRGLMGRLLLDQCSARKAGSDPHTGRLRLLLQDAATVMHDDLVAAGQSLPRAERGEIHRHLAVCEQVGALAEDDAAGVHAPLTDTLAPPASTGVAA